MGFLFLLVFIFKIWHTKFICWLKCQPLIKCIDRSLRTVRGASSHFFFYFIYSCLNTFHFILFHISIFNGMHARSFYRILFVDNFFYICFKIRMKLNHSREEMIEKQQQQIYTNLLYIFVVVVTYKIDGVTFSFCHFFFVVIRLNDYVRLWHATLKFIECQ